MLHKSEQTFDQDAFVQQVMAFEKMWNAQTGGDFPSEPVGDQLAEVQRVADKYFPDPGHVEL